ncbi:MAG: hypothetical protein GX813_03355 [Erysipelotrichia bacterium]|nr:hypothetical protein [Erysipelotrichia bacterium]
MVELLKNFGKGILYVIGLPFFLATLVCFAVYGFIAFVLQVLVSIFLFFTGRKFFPDLPEDKKLKALKASKQAALMSAPNKPEPQMNIGALDIKSGKKR